MTTVSVDNNACVRVQNEWTSNTGNEQARGTLVTLIQTESELQYWLKSFHKSTGGKDCNTIHSMMKNSVGARNIFNSCTSVSTMHGPRKTNSFYSCMHIQRFVIALLEL